MNGMANFDGDVAFDLNFFPLIDEIVTENEFHSPLSH